jgi:hypothetical protein
MESKIVLIDIKKKTIEELQSLIDEVIKKNSADNFIIISQNTVINETIEAMSLQFTKIELPTQPSV